MILYLSILLILSFFCFGKIKNVDENKIFLMFIILFWILATFRNLEIGNDTNNYYILFKSICNSKDYSLWLGRYEQGYLSLNLVVSYFTDNFTIFLAIVNTFIFNAYYMFINKYSKNKLLSLFLFFTLGFWGNIVNIIRLQIATAFYMYAWIKKDEGKRYLPIILAIIAFLFQRISIIFVFSFIVPKKIEKKYFVLFTMLGIVFFFYFEKLIYIISNVFPYFGTYLNSNTYLINDVAFASVINIIIRFIVFSFGIWIIFNTKEGQLNTGLIQQVNCMFISFVLMVVSLKFNLLDRCASFYWVFSILLIPNSIIQLKQKSNKLFITFFVIIIAISLFGVTNIYRPEWNHIYPYKFIFS